MLGEKHDLVHELPEFRDQITFMKTSSRRFAHLYEDYHQVDHEVRRIEMGSEVASDEYLEQQKKMRLELKDQLFAMLRQ